MSKENVIWDKQEGGKEGRRPGTKWKKDAAHQLLSEKGLGKSLHLKSVSPGFKNLLYCSPVVGTRRR